MARTTAMKRPDPARMLRRRRISIVALSLFVIVDAILVGTALNVTRPSVERVPGSVATGTTPKTPASASATPTAPAIAAVMPTRMLVAADGSVAWRATTGPCPDTQAAPELTTDAGSTWKATSATAPTGIRSLQSIAVEGTRTASMIGQSSKDCSPMLVRTYVAGDNYQEYPAALAGFWYVNPLNRAVVHGPAGDLAAPCTAVLSLAHRNDSNKRNKHRLPVAISLAHDAIDE